MNKKPIELRKTREFTMLISEGELITLKKVADKHNQKMSEYIILSMISTYFNTLFPFTLEELKEYDKHKKLNKERKKTFTMLLSDGQYNTIYKLAHKYNKSMSDLVRIAISIY